MFKPKRILSWGISLLILLVLPAAGLVAEPMPVEQETEQGEYATPPPAKLYVYSDMEGFTVRLLGYEEEFYQGIELSSGQYRIRVIFPKGGRVTQTIHLFPGEERDFFASMYWKSRVYLKQWQRRANKYRAYLNSVADNLDSLQTSTGKRLTDFTVDAVAVKKYPDTVGLILLSESMSDYWRQEELNKLSKATEEDVLKDRDYLLRERLGFWAKHWKQEDVEPALSIIESVLERVPSSAYYTFLHGQILLLAGDGHGALHAFELAVSFDPNLAIAYNPLAWLLATADDERLRDGEKAISYAKKAVDLLPHPNHLDTLAAAYAEAGRWGEAVQTVEKATEELGDMYASQRLRDELNQHMRAFKDKIPWREMSAKPFPDNVLQEREQLKQKRVESRSTFT